MEALQCYDRATVPPIEYSGRAYLLLALHLQRMSEVELARKAFRDGVSQFKTDAKLMQAWGLFESKSGNMRRARALINRAVKLDPSLRAVLRWKIFREDGPVTNRYISQAARVGRSSVIRASATTPAMLVRAPAIRYTVRTQNIGWRGRGCDGEDASKWYDREGERQGPPLNFWRQAADERLYEANMAVVRAAVGGGNLAEAVEELERRMSIRLPCLNRKLLGTWAVLSSGGRLPSPTATGDRLEVAARAIVELQRLTPPTEPSAHLQPDEPLQLRVTSERGEQCVQLRARRDAPPFPSEAGVPLGLRHISFLSDYLLVGHTEPDGAVEVWMRVREEWNAPSHGPYAPQ